MATGAQIKAMMESHAERDDSRFYSVASQVAASEARKGHDRLATDIRDMIDEFRRKSKLPKPRELGDSVINITRPEGEASDLLEMVTTSQKIGDLIANHDVMAALEEGIEEQLNISKIKSYGLTPQRTFLFTGPPGCGKTMAASVIANSLGLPLFTIRIDSIITRFLGESSTKLRAVFSAIEQTRAVYLFDEFDSLGLERGGASQDVAEMRRVLNSFLVFIENYKGNSVIISATNHVESLDLALFRRFDSLIEFSMPTEEQCFKALDLRLTQINPSKRIGLKKVAKEALGLNFADLARVVESALKSVILGESDVSISAKLLSTEISKRKRFLAKSRRKMAL